MRRIAPVGSRAQVRLVSTCDPLAIKPLYEEETVAGLGNPNR